MLEYGILHAAERFLRQCSLHLDTKNLTKEEVELMFLKKKKKGESQCFKWLCLGYLCDLGQQSILAKFLHLANGSMPWLRLLQKAGDNITDMQAICKLKSISLHR